MERLSLLVVDDEPGICSGVIRILSRHTVSFPFMDDDYGFDCREASSGEEALDILARDPPDIMLLDNKLPGISGIEVLEEMRRRRLDISVAMITSFASLEVAAKATDDGARDFIPKPFTPSELTSSIDLITKQYFLKRITRDLKEEGKRIRFQFLSVLSHELKSPLNALEGYLELMRGRDLGERMEAYDEYLDRCLQRIEGMRSLILDLLDLTRIGKEREREKASVVNLEERCLLALSAVKPMAIQRNVGLEYNGDPGITMRAVPSDLDMILNNLLSNAVKYNREGGSVFLGLQKRSDRIEIAVRDTGIGMNREELEQLFEEFVRIRNKRTEGITGSGLGLSIVQRICDLYGGNIAVESEPEQGSEFRVSLPAE